MTRSKSNLTKTMSVLKEANQLNNVLSVYMDVSLDDKSILYYYIILYYNSKSY